MSLIPHSSHLSFKLIIAVEEHTVILAEDATPIRLPPPCSQHRPRRTIGALEPNPLHRNTKMFCGGNREPLLDDNLESDMPIVGSTTTAATTTLGPGPIERHNASEYSHSTVFITQAADDASYTNLNAPPLTTHYTPPRECVGRWMLAGGQTVIITLATVGNTTTRRIAATPPAAETSVPSVPIAPPSSVAAITPRADFIAQNHTVFSLDLNGTATDPSYRKCQPYQLAPTYSPGICPDGQTVAEVTAWQLSASTGYRTFWQASCCRSGMTFGPEFYAACISTFSAPLQALALITTSPFNGASLSTTYEYTSRVYISSASIYSTVTISSTTQLTTGLAVADPVVIAWQIEDFRLFPSTYAASLAAQIGVNLSPTDIGAEPASLSTAAKVGIGVGALIGALAVITALVVLCLKRRRQKTETSAPPDMLPEMADQDHDLATKKWWAGGKWRSEAAAHAEPQELESKTVHVVPGPPAELEGSARLLHPHETGQVVFAQREQGALET
ncbi:hypothetical protein OPT61_g7973 [Boeremia exigua]|uniref:Uncharacterized protein n=1 Tax=Boeremia exigua TaxID=749465 RepID=A0ACC2I046_9PLEO|nr:hypothetical protein OPT61_g7973 [Boeremia exigua]